MSGDGRIVVLPSGAEALREYQTQSYARVSAALRLRERIPEHLRRLEIPSRPELVEALGIACVFAFFEVAIGVPLSDRIRRPRGAHRTRGFWPAHRDAMAPREICDNFNLWYIVQGDATPDDVVG